MLKNVIFTFLAITFLRQQIQWVLTPQNLRLDQALLLRGFPA